MTGFRRQGVGGSKKQDREPGSLRRDHACSNDGDCEACCKARNGCSWEDGILWGGYCKGEPEEIHTCTNKALVTTAAYVVDLSVLVPLSAADIQYDSAEWEPS